MPKPGRDSLPPPDSQRRRRFFRLAVALLVPGFVLLLAEGILRFSGRHYPTTFFVKSPVPGDARLVENDQFSRRYFAPPLMRIPRPVTFQPAKPPDALRVFVFGESAAEGDPGPAFGFARILQVLLRESYPGRKVEVINTAVTAINSHVILPIARECADYGGDVWILYIGNNEVVGPFGAGTVFGPQAPSRAFVGASLDLKTTSIGQALDDLLWNVSRKRATAPAGWEGMEMFLQHQVRGDDPLMASVYRHFERNFDGIIRAGVDSGARVVVSSAGSNLRDCAPFASLLRADLTAKQGDEWNAHYQTGAGQEDRGEFAAAIETFSKANAIDNASAELHFRLARCQAALGHREKAREEFVLARDFDTLRFRADSRINEIIRTTAGEWPGDRVALVDADALFSRDSADGVPGAEHFHDHVHLTFRANYLLALAYAKAVTNWFKPSNPPVSMGWLSEDACAARLALTDWERLMMAEDIGRRRQRPPFTGQLDYAARQNVWEQRLAELRTRAQSADPKAAANQFTGALAKAGDDWQLEHNFAVELLRQTNRTAAAQHFRRVIQLLPHYLPAYDFLGSTLLEEDQAATAEDVYRRALAVRPDYFDGLLGLGRALARQGKQAEAISQFQAAVRRDPNNSTARLTLARSLARARQPEAALQQFREAVRVQPHDPRSRTALAQALANANRLPESLEHFEAAAKFQPESAEAQNNLGTALAALGRRIEAIRHFSEALRLQPDFALAYMNLGSALLAENRVDEAVAALKEAVRLRPDDPRPRQQLEVALSLQQTGVTR